MVNVSFCAQTSFKIVDKLDVVNFLTDAKLQQPCDTLNLNYEGAEELVARMKQFWLEIPGLTTTSTVLIKLREVLVSSATCVELHHAREFTTYVIAGFDDYPDQDAATIVKAANMGRGSDNSCALYANKNKQISALVAEIEWLKCIKAAIIEQVACPPSPTPSHHDRLNPVQWTLGSRVRNARGLLSGAPCCGRFPCAWIIGLFSPALETTPADPAASIGPFSYSSSSSVSSSRPVSMPTAIGGAKPIGSSGPGSSPVTLAAPAKATSRFSAHSSPIGR
ncbi:hypothetical protein BDW59DRAFT_157622 [Aspergillus cavernicola]|uniref:GED domain-containing protein n=1 Tax=Aspergillus cavernicola TaxID=176166 RepID=A0ABR4IWL2_9EURO